MRRILAVLALVLVAVGMLLAVTVDRRQVLEVPATTEVAVLPEFSGPKEPVKLHLTNSTGTPYQFGSCDFGYFVQYYLTDGWGRPVPRTERGLKMLEPAMGACTANALCLLPAHGAFSINAPALAECFVLRPGDYTLRVRCQPGSATAVSPPVRVHISD